MLADFLGCRSGLSCWFEGCFDAVKVIIGEGCGYKPGFKNTGWRVNTIVEKGVEERCVTECVRLFHVGEIMAFPVGESYGKHGGGTLNVVGDADGTKRIMDEIGKPISMSTNSVVYLFGC